MGRISKKVLVTWTMTVVHPVTSGAGADSLKTAKGYTWEMETK
jgi:hypothetical protein